MPRPDAPPPTAADLPFLIFAGVADSAHAVGAAEADAFFRLLQDRAWVRCAALAAALPEAAKQYPEHWRRYIAGDIVSTVPAVLQAASTVAGRLTADNAALLEADLLHLAAALRAAAKRPRLPAPASSARLFAGLESVLRSSAPAEGAGAPPPAPRVPAREAATGGEPVDRQTTLIAQAAPWNSVHTRLRCVRVTDETSDVRTFHFASEPERLFSYKPGQFMTIEVEIGGRKVRRNYTIASSPSRPHLIEITVKRIASGLVSSWLHEHLNEGDALHAVIANGKFTCWDIQAEKTLLLSAGVGITPVMSMARWQADLCADVDAVFFHSARTPADIVFRKELELLRGPRFKVMITCTRPTLDEDWTGLRGRVDATMLTTAVPDFRERVVFMCGPDSYMETMRATLIEAGCPPGQIHQESFGPRFRGTSDGAPPERVAAAAPIGEARIVFARSRKEVTCPTDEPILEVAERSGIEIASSCRVGACGTCKVLKTSGVVHHEHCPGLSAAEAEQGFVLTCSSTAEGTVILDL